MSDDYELEVEQNDEGQTPDEVEQVKKLNARERDRHDAQQFWKAVFASEVGRREMWRVLEACHTFSPVFACGPTGFPQPEATWFHAGEQAVGQRLYQSWALLDRAGMFAMLDEHDPRFTKPKAPAKRKRGE
jgi:hypothetical protein